MSARTHVILTRSSMSSTCQEMWDADVADMVTVQEATRKVNWKAGRLESDRRSMQTHMAVTPGSLGRPRTCDP
eukprot:583138-Pleurochrysis_carterae.AAC.1